MLHQGHIFFVADRWIAWRVLRHIVAITICFIPMNIHMHWNARMMEDYKKTHEWWVNVPTSSQKAVENKNMKKTSYIFGIMIQTYTNIYKHPWRLYPFKSLAQNKFPPQLLLFLCFGMDNVCLRSPRLHDYCFRKNRGFKAKGEPSEEKNKSNWIFCGSYLAGAVKWKYWSLYKHFYWYDMFLFLCICSQNRLGLGVLAQRD